MTQEQAQDNELVAESELCLWYDFLDGLRETGENPFTYDDPTVSEEQVV